MKEKLLNLATVLLALVAVGAIAASLARMWSGGGTAAAVPAAALVADRPVANERELAATGQVMGDPAAPVRVVVFSDFECTYCRRAARDLARIRGEMGGRVAVVFRHFPVGTVHAHARAAAEAAECAGAQGRFEAYHDALFAEQPTVASEDWGHFARIAAVPDTAAFARCVAAHAHRPRVLADIRAGADLGVVGTPSFVVGGTLITGADMARVERAVRDAAAKSGR